ncbi:MAG: TolC family protein [Candidatus Riflebacteria bacterium]|nr:TolC family protein [Candidatus Riflebacteria bacterium]
MNRRTVSLPQAGILLLMLGLAQPALAQSETPVAGPDPAVVVPADPAVPASDERPDLEVPGFRGDGKGVAGDPGATRPASGVADAPPAPGVVDPEPPGRDDGSPSGPAVPASPAATAGLVPAAPGAGDSLIGGLRERLLDLRARTARQKKGLELTGDPVAPGPVQSGPPEPSADLPAPALPSETAPATGTLTLAQALQLALANNREIASQRSSLAISREQVREARTHGVPTLNVQNLQTHVDRLTSLGPVTIGLHDTNISQVVLKHPLYTFGRIENGVRAAQEVSGAERLALQAKEADVALRVIQAFVQVLKKHNRATIAGETLAVLRRHLELTRTLFEAGVVLSTDVATTKVKVLEAQQKLIEEENAWAIARETLANLLVVPVSTLGEPAGLAGGALPGPVCAPALAEGRVEDNPELRRFEGLIRGLDRKKRVERAGTLPTVGLQANWSTGNAYTEFYENWNAVVVVDLPLFEGGLARSRAQQAQHEIDRAVQGRELVRESLQLARQTSLLRLHEMEKKIALSEEAVKTARENLDQNELNYKEGTVLNTDVLEAQLLLNDAKVSLNNALFDYISWQAEHAKHVGRLGEFLRAVLGPAADSLPSL